MVIRIGLAMLQGARHEHAQALYNAADELKLEIEVIPLRSKVDIIGEKIDGIILPGGESTTMRKTGGDLESGGSGLLPALFSHLRESNSPVLGTCAGAILLCNPDDGGEPLFPASIDRNAYGRQTDSFQDVLDVSLFNSQFPGVFIRAPRFNQSSIRCDSIVFHENEVVGIKHNSRMALTFHPELTNDSRFHVWLLQQASHSSE